MLANLSITSVITLWVYATVNLLETYPIVRFSPFVCGMVVTIFRKLVFHPEVVHEIRNNCLNVLEWTEFEFQSYTCQRRD